MKDSRKLLELLLDNAINFPYHFHGRFSADILQLIMIDIILILGNTHLIKLIQIR